MEPNDIGCFSLGKELWSFDLELYVLLQSFRSLFVLFQDLELLLVEFLSSLFVFFKDFQLVLVFLVEIHCWLLRFLFFLLLLLFLGRLNFVGAISKSRSLYNLTNFIDILSNVDYLLLILRSHLAMLISFRDFFQEIGLLCNIHFLPLLRICVC